MLILVGLPCILAPGSRGAGAGGGGGGARGGAPPSFCLNGMDMPVNPLKFGNH